MTGSTREVLKILPSENVQTYQVVPIEFNPNSSQAEDRDEEPGQLPGGGRPSAADGVQRRGRGGRRESIDEVIKKHFTKAESMLDVVSALPKDEKFKSLRGPRRLDRS
jgi:hypothetical protein